MGGCREILGEKSVARREFPTGVGLLPYLAAKLFALLLVLGGQCVVLTVLVVPTVLGYSPAATAGLGGVLWLGAIAAGAVGLLISALADSPRTAATAVPLVMVPQLLLGGILRPEVDMPHDLYWPRWIAALTVQRWAFEPALALDDNPRTRVMVQQWGDSPETYREIWDVIRFDEHGGDTVAMYFPGGPTGRHFILPCAVLVAGSVGAVGVAYLRLRRQFLR